MEHPHHREPYMDEPDMVEIEDFDDEFSPSITEMPCSTEHQHSDHFRSSRWSKWERRMGIGGVIALAMAVAGFFLGQTIDQSSSDKGPSTGVIAYLEYMQISSAEAFSNSQSPQSQAIEWILRHDIMELPTTSPEFVQRYIMAVFFFALVPSSMNMMFREEIHFLSGHHHECDWQAEWNHRHIEGLKIKMGVQCDDENHVTSIILPTLGLTGELPPELAKLSSLQKINLDANQIFGEIPIVPTLTSLFLAYNALEGTIPSAVGLMTNLRELSLSDNFLTGQIPEDIADLTQLYLLAVNGNELTGGVHNIFHMTSLEEVYGGFNSLKDGFDNDSFGHLTNLRVLDMKNNKLEGPFPDVLWTLPHLKVVDFHHNALDGHLHEIKDRNDPVIEHLDVSTNFLSGGVPTTFNKLVKLTHLDISSNRFEKLLPEDLGELKSLETLLLTDNSSFGPQSIPTWLQNLTSLKYLSLKLTGRTGTIPEWFPTKLSHLRILDLDWNHISGTISPDFGQMSHLQHLMLNRNWLDGTVPSELARLPHLQTIMIDNNRLFGELVACQANTILADCGNPNEGCPNCESTTMEVSCPCCTGCCYDDDELCNAEDWLSAILEAKRSQNEWGAYSPKYRPSEYTREDIFDPPTR